ncbi:transcriptional regulator, TetR family [Williamsia sterculiae]|uniref:Transcriptional regulator, TetR family n=2 Tax=Williamsia sterculiae TaxID=1344003 RepID=A0A1N7EQP2_9NOCA|nr:transcriptional regulator, TetR family [Williamsia sterculiae]
MLLELGYADASVSAIAAEAGFTTGAFYSNFPSKGALALEVLDDLQSEAAGRLEAIFAGGRDVSTTIRATRAWTEEVLASGWPRLELEFALANRRNPDVVSTEGKRNRAAADRIARLLEQVVPGPQPFTPYRIAEVILDLAFGLALRRIIDPSVTTDHVFDLIDAMVATGGDFSSDATPQVLVLGSGESGG